MQWSSDCLRLDTRETPLCKAKHSPFPIYSGFSSTIVGGNPSFSTSPVCRPTSNVEFNSYPTQMTTPEVPETSHRCNSRPGFRLQSLLCPVLQWRHRVQLPHGQGSNAASWWVTKLTFHTCLLSMSISHHSPAPPQTLLSIDSDSNSHCHDPTSRGKVRTSKTLAYWMILRTQPTHQNFTFHARRHHCHPHRNTRNHFHYCLLRLHSFRHHQTLQPACLSQTIYRLHHRHFMGLPLKTPPWNVTLIDFWRITLKI
jgi:hypothetical protein